MLRSNTTNRFLYRHRLLRPVSLVVQCILLLAFVSCGGSASTPPPTPTTTIQFVTFDLGIPAQALNAPVVGSLSDTTKMHVVVTFKANKALLNQLNKQKVKPRQNSNLKSLANQIGISDATYQKIQAFFGVENATLKLSDLHTTLAIDAPTATFAKLLRIKFVIHQLNGRKFYTPTTSPTLPKFVADTIAAITGLDNYSPPPTLPAIKSQTGQARPGSGKHTHQDCSPTIQAIGPVAVAHAYGYDQLYSRGWHGENMTVNLFEIDGFDSNDIQNYFNCVNYTGKFQAFTVDSSAPPPGGENTLDIDMVAGLATAANIVDYQTSFDPNADIWTQVNDELQQILNDNMSNTSSGDVVSISLGTDERQFTSSDLTAIDQSLQELTQAEHMTVFVSSGDCGAFTSMVPNDLSVSFPASDTWVAAVGGTELSFDGNDNRTNEVVWSNASDPSHCRHGATNQGSEWGSGGGVSTEFPTPTWETGNGVTNRFSNGHRQVPDISAVASDLLVYFQSAWTAFDGTSAATPIWAAGFELLNEGIIQTKQIFYYAPDTFYAVANNSGSLHPYYDVTSGNNLFYSATPGWDDVTGWGTPNLADFFQVLTNLAGQQ